MNDKPHEPAFTDHALAQMGDREISKEDVLALVRSVEPFRYYHRGRVRSGFYDEGSRLFVAVAEDKVVTVFHTRPSYVAGLRGRS